MNKEALRLAAHAEANAHFGDMKSIAAELRRLHDLLGKANALARIRKERIAELEDQLKSMVTCFERYEDTNTAMVMDAARATIAKATGGAA